MTSVFRLALSGVSALILGGLGGLSDVQAQHEKADPVAAAAKDPRAPGSASAERYQNIKLAMPSDMIVGDADVAAARNAYYGDLHVHTTYSFDAFAFGTLATPYDAYRYALGETIKHPAGFDVKLREPLDFYAVTDHAMFLGLLKEAADTTTEFSKLPYVKYMHGMNDPENLHPGTIMKRLKAYTTFMSQTLFGIDDGKIDLEMVNDVARSAWLDTIKAAEQFNDPGTFTTFVAYEYTASSADRGNLHRNVIFEGADKLPALPFSRYNDVNPESLWDWMDNLRDQGVESLAIPHNSNGSNGQMFKLVDWAGDPMDDAYAQKRARNEPLVEITQVKGTSETHPALSDTDEWADFEIMPYRVATNLPSKPRGSYVREALLNGLAFEDKGAKSPYKFGFIGSSDTHTAAISDDETDYFAKVDLMDATATLRGSVPIPEGQTGLEVPGMASTQTIDGKPFTVGASETFGASGLAAVWAEENSREAIYAAFRRKETFATSGPRLKVRLFAGYGFDNAMLKAHDGVARAYTEGVPMGGDLLARGGEAPTLMAWAVRDAKSAKLQRLQIVKGWTVDGAHNEKVYDIACSDGGVPDPATARCPDNGARVDLSDCSITRRVGDAELKTVWKDPDFDPSVRAFYYVRALENPTCRWSTWDALRAGEQPRSDLKATIQERAWSSPIWYIPQG
jgi:hypothetical protein